MSTPQHPRGGYAHKGCQCSGCIPRTPATTAAPTPTSASSSKLVLYNPLPNKNDLAPKEKLPPVLRATTPISPSAAKAAKDITITIPYPEEIPLSLRDLAEVSHLSVLLYGKDTDGNALTFDNAVTVTGVWADGFRQALPKIAPLPKKLSAKVVAQRIITLPDTLYFGMNVAIDVTVDTSVFGRKYAQGPYHLEAVLFAPGVWKWSGYVYPVAPVRS